MQKSAELGKRLLKSYIQPMPTCTILAGPNGAGKSTAAPQLVHSVLGIDEFVTADVIARGLAGTNSKTKK